MPHPKRDLPSSARDGQSAASIWGPYWCKIAPLTQRRLALAAFTCLIAIVYLASPVIQSQDGRLVVYEAHAILHHGTTELSEFGAAVDGFPCYRVGGRVISRYPYGAALVTAPLLLVFETGGKLLGDDPAAHLRQHPPLVLDKTLASLIAALGCLALVLLGLEVTGRLTPGLLVGFLYAFGTAMWSTVSRGLWQHGPLILLVTMALICLERARHREDRRWVAAAGLALGAAFVVRPTAAFPLALVVLYLALTNRRNAVVYAGAAAAVILPSAAYNEHIYGQALNPFYFANQAFLAGGLRSTFFTGLAGTMVSPARGLLVYSPVLLLAVIGVALVLRRRGLNGLQLIAIATTAALWLTVANTVDWPGGYSYGPRLLSDTFPWLAFLMLPAADVLTRASASWNRHRATSVVVLTLAFAWSVFVNARGALSWSTMLWNVTPVPADVSANSGRFWDWSDPAFLRFGHHALTDLYSQDIPAIPPGTECLKG